jgi:hypothetical protein
VFTYIIKQYWAKQKSDNADEQQDLKKVRPTVVRAAAFDILMLTKDTANTVSNRDQLGFRSQACIA